MRGGDNARRGRAYATNVRAGDLTDVIDKLRMSGSEISVGESEMRIRTHRVGALRAYTQPYPGFPTDMKAQFMALACTARGTSMIVEKTMFESRFAHAAQFTRMGADIWINDRGGCARQAAAWRERKRARPARRRGAGNRGTGRGGRDRD